MSIYDPDSQTEILTEDEHTTEEPPMYKVLLHNDSYTTKEFVVYILVTIFNKSLDEATRLMFNVHRNGIGAIGTYSHQVAETKIGMSTTAARENGYPLKLTLEKE